MNDHVIVIYSLMVYHIVGTGKLVPCEVGVCNSDMISAGIMRVRFYSFEFRSLHFGPAMNFSRFSSSLGGL
jgi:hypothetical protein